jgi:hypothetical protein
MEKESVADKIIERVELHEKAFTVVESVFQDLIADLCIKYDLPYVNVYYMESSEYWGEYDYGKGITLNFRILKNIANNIENKSTAKKWLRIGIWTLLHEFRHHYQYHINGKNEYLAYEQYINLEHDQRPPEKDADKFAEENIINYNIDDLYYKILFSCKMGGK